MRVLVSEFGVHRVVCVIVDVSVLSRSGCECVGAMGPVWVLVVAGGVCACRSVWSLTGGCQGCAVSRGCRWYECEVRSRCRLVVVVQKVSDGAIKQ